MKNVPSILFVCFFGFSISFGSFQWCFLSFHLNVKMYQLTAELTRLSMQSVWAALERAKNLLKWYFFEISSIEKLHCLMGFATVQFTKKETIVPKVN